MKFTLNTLRIRGLLKKSSSLISAFTLLLFLVIHVASADYYTPTNVTSFPDIFSFGDNLNTGGSIQWKQEVVGSPYNNEIQDYVKEQVGLDDNNNCFKN